MAIRTEADVVRTLKAGTYTLDELYRLTEATVDITRDGGMDEIHPGDRRWRRRLRGALQHASAKGTGRRVRRATWVIDGPREAPRRMILIHAAATVAEFELRLQDAIALLQDLDEPADLVVTDPPYALARDRGGAGEGLARRVYSQRRNVVPGYRDVDPGQYREFTYRWIAVAAAALRPAGQLVVVTGPQQAALHQIAAEDAGLTFVSSIAARREFALRTTRRPAMAFSARPWGCGVRRGARRTSRA